MRHIAKYHKMRPLAHATVFIFFCYVYFSALNSVVLAGPEGAEVIHGRVSFQKNGLNTVITASDKSIVNYKSFNISRPEAVQFVQPHSNASVLNRINSANPTHINGTLTANGRVFFVNPAGVYIGNGAKINVNQLVASGLNISNSDFINGKYHFSGGHGSVENRGDITAEKVHLIGKQVANYGTINCPGGYVVMAAGDRVFLGKPGNDLTVEVDTKSLPEPTDLDVGVRNEGTINAAGGEIILAAAGDIYSQAISNVGTLSASMQDGDAGEVKLIAKKGNINNKGSIKTTSKSGKGGTVTTEGSEVINSGTVDVTGSEGGQVTMKGKRVGQFGTVHADGTKSHGGNVTLTADEVVALGSDSLTTANAGLNGKGGDVTVSSSNSALFSQEAKIEAKGGSKSGDGGFVEVSGKEHVEIYGLAEVSANNGDGGTFFIDPHNVTIQNSPGSLDNQSNPFEAGSDGDTVSDDAIESVINSGGAAVIQTSDGGLEDGDIIQDADAAIDFTGAGGDARLTFNAADDVELNGGITASGAAAITVTINANGDYDTPSGEGDVDINADISTNGGSFTSSGIGFDNTGGEIHTNGGNVNLDGHSGAIIIGANIVAGTGDISATSGSSVLVRNQANNITAGNVDIVTVGRFACEPGSRITARGDGTDLNINAGHIDLNADGVGNETLTNTGSGTITLAASGDIFLSNNSINVDEGAVDIDSSNIITAEGTDEGTDSEIKANGLVSLTAGAIGDEQNPLDLDGADELKITATVMENNFNRGEIRIKENTSTITSTTINVDDPYRYGIYIDYAEVNGNDDIVDIGFDTPGHYITVDLDNDNGSSFSYTAGTGNIHLSPFVDSVRQIPINMGENGDVMLSTPDRIDFYDSGHGLTPITTVGGSVNLTASEITGYNPDGSAPLGIQGATALTLTDRGAGPIWLAEVGDSTIGSTSITVGNVGYGTIYIDYDDERYWIDIDDNHFINRAFPSSSFSYTATHEDIQIGIIDAGTADVALEANAGAIRDAVDDNKLLGYQNLDVKGGTIDLTAQVGGIGTPVLIDDEGIGFEDRILTVNSQELNADTTADGGDIYIVGAPMSLGLVNAKKDAETIGDVFLLSLSINDASDDKDVDIVGNTVTLWTKFGIGGNTIAGKTEDIYGAIETDATRLEALSEGDIVEGDIVAGGMMGGIVIVEKDDVALSSISTNNGSIFLETTDGAMTHDGETIKAATGITLESSGNITTNTLETNEGDISIHSKDGDLIVNGNVTASNGGVSIIADNGKIYTEPSDSDSVHLDEPIPSLNAQIIGYSDQSEDIGVGLPFDENQKAAIVVSSKENLKLGTGAILSANGAYDPTIYDDLAAVNFEGGDPIDVAIYVGSYDFENQTGGNVTVDSAVAINPGGTMVIDAENTVMPFSETFTNSWSENNDSTNRLEVVSRTTETLNQAVDLGTLPYADEVIQGNSPDSLGDSEYVLRGGRAAEVIRSEAEVPRSIEAAPLNYLNEEDEEYVSLHTAAEFIEEPEPLQLLVIREGKYVKAQRNMVLERGDEIITPPGMTAFIHFVDGSEIIMMPDTDIVIENPTIFTRFGKIIARVRKTFKVRTKYVTAGVKGTLFTVDVSKDEITVIKVIEGNISLDPNDPNENLWSSVSLGPGEQVRIWNRQEPQIEMIPKPEYEQIIWSITALEQDIAEIPKVTEGIAVLRDFKFGGIEGTIKDDYPLFNVWH